MATNVCFNCQRMMTESIPDKLFICRYCGFVNFKLPTEHTSFVVSWLDEDKVEDVKNVPVMYWTPPKQEEEEPGHSEPSGDNGDDT